jgi:hypothetical protein
VAAEILEVIQPATVRAVCYQLFNRKLIPSMDKNCTDRVSKQLVYARERGMIPWAWIVDESRHVQRRTGWDNPAAFLDQVQSAYRRDYWDQQPRRCEVWSEKGTVRGTLLPVQQEYKMDAPRIMHGFGSATAVHDAADESWTESDQPLIVFYVGDWDPSGMYMNEVDLPKRLERYEGNVQLVRVALTTEDIGDPALPGFAASEKKKDPRYPWFVANHGHQCWELDALNPAVLRQRLEAAIHDVIDWRAWQRCAATEQQERQSIHDFIGRWNDAIA